MDARSPRYAVLVALGLGLASSGCGTEPPPARNLLVVSLDTVRRDHLTPYGYARDTTPRLAQLARGAVVFDNAFAQETNTAPSHASMFTGVYPHDHGCRTNGQGIAPDQVTLAEILTDAGFRTAAFVSGSPMLARATRLDRGFATYDDRFAGHRRSAADTMLQALWWLTGVRPEERYFAFVHLYDAHGPYLPPARYARLFRADSPGPTVRVPAYQQVADAEGRVSTDLNYYVDRYDALIRYLDDTLALLLDTVDLADTVVVVLSDHGETLGERYQALDHGDQVFDEQIRIPLILHAPDLAPQRTEALVETVDLLPTLLELLGVERPAERPVAGKSLVDLLDGNRPAGRERTYATARPDDLRHADRGYLLDERQRIQSVRSSGWKLIRYPGVAQDYFELYDLAADPREESDRAARSPEVVDEYRRHLEGWSEGADPVVPTPELDPGLREKLESLGYVGG